MDHTEKNGQPSMEEILASIRRIIAEEPTGGSPVIDIRARAKPHLLTSMLDEQSEFELPAIFRPNAQPAPEKSTPLFGRLTDAIRSASAVVSEPRAARPVEGPAQEPAHVSPLQPAVVSAMPTAGAPAWHEPPMADTIPDPALSQLNLSRPEPLSVHPYEPVRPEASAAPASHAVLSVEPPPAEPPSMAEAVSDWWHGRQLPVEAAPEPQEEVKRVMVPFRDTRMVRMSAVGAPSPAASAAPPAALPAGPAAEGPRHGIDFAAIVPARMDIPGAPVVHSLATAEPEPFRPVAHQVAARPHVEPVDVPSSHVPAAPYMVPEPEPLIPRPVIASVPPLAPREAAAWPEPPRILPGPSMARDHGSHPQQAAPASGTTHIEDATADLLRPMLRQWLAENMPRMVEKALHIEVAESVKTGKKPGSG